MGAGKAVTAICIRISLSHLMVTVAQVVDHNRQQAGITHLRAAKGVKEPLASHGAAALLQQRDRPLPQSFLAELFWATLALLVGTRSPADLAQWRTRYTM